MNKAWHFVGLGVFAVIVYVGNGMALLPPSAHAAKAGPNVVNVITKEYGFEMPSSIPAGPTLFHLTDEGKELHHLTLVKLNQGKTLTDFTSLPPGPFPKWAVFMGGPNTPTPQHGYVEDVVNLTPGHYAALCVIPDSKGKPHMMDGMVKALTVTPSKEKRAMPAADLTLTLASYSFKFSKPVTAGKHIVRIINHGDQPHEAVIFQLAPGKRGEDIADWVTKGMQGPPPGAPVAGITAEAPKHSNTLIMDLKPGEYAVMCFMPDAKDGKPHIAHGMIYNFKVS